MREIELKPKRTGGYDMQEVFEKIIERLEEKIVITWKHDYQGGQKDAFNEAIEIVNQVAEEYAHRNCMHCKYESLPITDEHCEYCMHQYSDDNFEPKEYSNSEIPNKSLESLHEKILKSKFAEEVTESEIDALVKAKKLTVNNQSLTNDGWIPCNDHMPEEPKSYEVTVRVLVNGKIEYITDYGVFLESGKWLTLNVVAWRERNKPYQPEGE